MLGPKQKAWLVQVPALPLSLVSSGSGAGWFWFWFGLEFWHRFRFVFGSGLASCPGPGCILVLTQAPVLPRVLSSGSDRKCFTRLTCLQEAQQAQPAKRAARAVTSLLEEVRAAAKSLGAPVAEGSYAGIKLAADQFLKGFNDTSLDAFLAVVRITLPALLLKVAEAAFSLPEGSAYRASRAAFLRLLEDMPAAAAQDMLARALPDRWAWQSGSEGLLLLWFAADHGLCSCSCHRHVMEQKTRVWTLALS